MRAIIIGLAMALSVPWTAFADDNYRVDNDVVVNGNQNTVSLSATAGSLVSLTTTGQIVIRYGSSGGHLKPGTAVVFTKHASQTTLPNAIVSAASGTVPVGWGTTTLEFALNSTVSASFTAPLASPEGGYAVKWVATTFSCLAGATDCLNGGSALEVNLVVNAQPTTATDTTPPSITYVLTGTGGSSGWYTTDVTIAWSVNDGESTFTEKGCGSTAISASGSVTCSATSAGGVGTETVTLKIDTTAPTGVAGPLSGGTLSTTGWYTTAPTATFNGTDPTSGIASCTTATYTGDDSASASISGSCTNGAGLSTNGSSPSFQIDTTAPTAVAGTLSSTPNGTNGWYTMAPMANFNGTDATSGIDSCTQGAIYAGGDSATASISGSCTDRAGLSSTASVGFKLDTTAPTIAFSGNAGDYGVDQMIAITCVALDALSGVQTSTCTGGTGAAYTFATGSNQVSATAIDKAGNTATATSSFTVTVTATGLCNLTKTFASKPLGSSLCAQLNAAAAAKARGNTQAAGNATAAYVREVQAQTGKAFTPEHARILIRLVGRL